MKTVLKKMKTVTGRMKIPVERTEVPPPVDRWYVPGTRYGTDFMRKRESETQNEKKGLYE